MVVLGAGGHAKEVLDILKDLNYPDSIAFFDNVTPDIEFPYIFNDYVRIRSIEELKDWFDSNEKDYVLGVGELIPRRKLRLIGNECSGEEMTLISKNACISSFGVVLGKGTIVMQLVFISTDVNIGKGVLINSRANLHHDVKIDDYCEIGPGAIILGKVKIGKESFIGAGAVILPKIIMGSNCVICTGSVVTKDVPENMVIKKNPAK